MSRAVSLPILSTSDDAAASRHITLPDSVATSRRLIDSHGRTIRDLRLSITDRCNFRCVYCMDPDVRFLSSDALLSIDELIDAARACVNLGVEGIRITGGEPTLHPRLTEIIERLAALPGVTDLSMTTNGSLITRERLTTWRNAGLDRLTISLDALDPAASARLSRSNVGPERIVEAITLALDAGLRPLKVNAVVMRGVNEDEIPALVTLALRLGFEMRFIEYMPLDSGRQWDRSLLVPASEILARITHDVPLEPIGRRDRHSTSETYRALERNAHPDARIGLIAPVTRSFCGACSRLRITADGMVRPCLFSLEEWDLKPALRSTRSSTSEDRPEERMRAIEHELLTAVWSKQAGHGITESGFVQPARPMSAIGG